MAAELEINGLPCLVFGDGPQLVVFPGLGLANANPTGVQRWGEIRLLSPLARRFTVHRIGRRVGLEPSTTMADLANDYAGTLGEAFADPVDVLGISTGGSLALRLAADLTPFRGSSLYERAQRPPTPISVPSG